VKERKPIIGLAGGISSGKSLVARILGEMGAGVISSDELNHKVLQREDVRQHIQEWWGEDLYDAAGQPDRKKLAAIVFHDERQRRRLEGLTHPLIKRCRQEILEQYLADPNLKAVVLDIPLLFEVELDQLCDQVIFVEVEEERRIERARQHRGWESQELRRREKQQNPLDIKRRRSDYIVENNSDINTLRQQVEKIYRQLITSHS